MGTKKRIGWATDLHLEFLSGAARIDFIDELARMELDILLVGGDTATAKLLHCYHDIEQRLPYQIYFVLGNHDFYGGSLNEVREWATTISKRLHWLPVSGIIELNNDTCLIGHNGWADGRLGDYDNSMVMLNDFLKIEELRGLDKNQRLTHMKKFGDEAASYVAEWLPRALNEYKVCRFSDPCSAVS